MVLLQMISTRSAVVSPSCACQQAASAVARRSSATATSSPAATSGVDRCLRAVSMASLCAAAHTPAAATNRACTATSHHSTPRMHCCQRRHDPAAATGMEAAAILPSRSDANALAVAGEAGMGQLCTSPCRLAMASPSRCWLEALETSACATLAVSWLLFVASCSCCISAAVPGCAALLGEAAAVMPRRPDDRTSGCASWPVARILIECRYPRRAAGT